MATTNYEKICEFHAAIGAVAEFPQLPEAETLALRQTLIREEYQEVMDAFVEVTAVPVNGRPPDIIPLAHELADLLYVVYGTFAALGVNADAVFAEVHRANMEKLNGPRRADGKLLKPPGWQPADVRGVIEQLSREP